MLLLEKYGDKMPEAKKADSGKKLEEIVAEVQKSVVLVLVYE